jgi:hypothetical protein
MTRAASLPLLICLFFVNNWASGQINSFPYTQSFEENFAVGSELYFLTGWWGNQLGSSTRIYRSTVAAHTGEGALVAEPTSTFVADIRLVLNTEALAAARLSFWARSGRNGSGTRASQLLLSFSADGGQSFSSPVVVGGGETFPNKDTEYTSFSFTLPPELAQNPQALVRWQVRRSEEGAGTAARIFLDDVRVEAENPRLQLLSVAARSATELLLQFNLPMAPASAEQPAHYTLNPNVAILAASVQAADSRQVVLKVEGLTAGAYELGVSDLEPAGAGEPLAPTTVPFTYSPLPSFRDVVINEIFADPNPKGALQPQPVVLPTAADAEFIELFNASAMPYNLQELQLNGSRLPSYELAPAAYVLLVPAGKEELYNSWGPLVAVSSWRSLGNSGARLQLTHAPSGLVLDSLRYDQSWYRDAGKHEGGWSLEQLDPYSQCSYAGNWRASAAPAGATPAAPNAHLSTTPDTDPPRLLQAVATDSAHIVLQFSNYIAPASLEQLQISLEPATAIREIQHLGEHIRLVLETPLLENTAYNLQLAGLTDCSGQEMEGQAPLIRPKAAAAGRLVINESMYDPAAGGAEWVELYNTTDHYLNLQGWQLGLQEGGLKASIVLSTELLLLPPHEYLVLTADAEGLMADFPETPPASILPLRNMPSLRNSGDTLVLLSPAAQKIELAPFADRLHHALLRNTKGVSLERIDPLRPSLSQANWTSAAYPPGGSPGRPNSQQHALELSAEALRIEPEVVEPTPDGMADVAFIHYQLPQPGLSGTLLILDASGREIQRLANNQLLGLEGVYQWDGTNSQGERVRNGYYIVLLSVFGTDGFSSKWRKTLVVSSWQ